MAPKTRPLLVRPGARYACFGDGLCCTDIHGLGPLTRREVTAIRRIDSGAAPYSELFEDHMLRTAADGGCVFLMADRRCALHAEHGPEAKPDGCRRFPLGLVATPSGGRITTEHRCPCRTLGDRPPLDASAAEGSLCSAPGRVRADRHIDEIRLRPRKRVAFSAWEPVERELLGRLAAGEPPARVIGEGAFPALRRTSWEAQADELISARDGTRFGHAAAWFGDTVLQLVRGDRPREPARPWADAFDRAEGRAPTSSTSREVWNDWLADQLWALKWAEQGSLVLARAELSTRVAVGEHIAGRLEAQGFRPDRAAAEAVFVVETVGESEYWEAVVKAIQA